MLDNLGYALGGMVDRMKEAFGVLISDPVRLGVAVLFAAIVLAVVIGSSYTINISTTITGTSLTFSCPASDSLILPILTSPTNMSAAFPQIQCTVGSFDIVALLCYFVEIVLIVLGGAYLAIAIFNLSG